MFENILNTLLPKTCVGCGKYPSELCTICSKKLKNYPSSCFVCKTKSESFCTHANCLKKTKIQNSFVCYKYDKIIEKLIIRLKYDLEFSVSKKIAKLIFESPNTPNLLKYSIVPVPVHIDTYRSRGFNQTEIILNELNLLYEKKLNIQNLLVKNKLTKHQIGHSKKERIKNLSGSFSIDKKQISNCGSNILIFDDICTTGSTLNIASNEIVQNIATASISTLALARG